ncbi:MAG: hypothetical protein A2511_03575 [Deltaproteobacteria bacterium RIFOXYD12_FULL_50_9]|nr:MAG: hypothetical protein A2511_03575 [Deltaproteobacteria bacterium RIFOXYD12_FULL_50_9]
MQKRNCWEYMRCGREPGGGRVEELGLCAAATEVRLANANGGKNGGRACWALTGTLCGNRVQGTFANKLGNCRLCEFYLRVKQEEGGSCLSTKAILKLLATAPLA